MGRAVKRLSSVEYWFMPLLERKMLSVLLIVLSLFLLSPLKLQESLESFNVKLEYAVMSAAEQVFQLSVSWKCLGWRGMRPYRDALAGWRSNLSCCTTPLLCIN
jgi:hypothetical protein